LITEIVADESIPSQEVSSIVSIASPVQSLNSQVNYIYDSLSSTSAFYTNLYTILKGNVGDQKIKIFIDNLVLRKDFVAYNSLMDNYDSSFPNYVNINSVITTILDTDNKPYWKEQSTVTEIQKLYTEMNDSFSKAEYDQAILKLNKIKTKAKVVIDGGFTEVNTETNWFNYIFAGVMILILIILLIFLKKKGSKKSNYKKKVSKKNSGSDIFKYYQMTNKPKYMSWVAMSRLEVTAQDNNCNLDEAAEILFEE
jgi:hypothetical protein